jgi:hypothetical protein
MKICQLKIAASVALLFWSCGSIACGWDGCFFTRPKDFLSNAARDVQDVAKTNIDQSLAIAKSMSKGDVQGAFSHVGKLVVEGECLGCKQAVTAVGGDASVDSVEQMVSTGFIILVENKSPLFATYDAVAKKAFVAKAVPPKPPIGPGGSTAKHEPQAYEAMSNAICIVASTKGKMVVAGFDDLPTLRNVKTNASTKYVDSLLGPGDTLSVSAPLCPGMNSAKNHQKSLEKINLVYRAESMVQRTGQKIHFEVIGSQPK